MKSAVTVENVSKYYPRFSGLRNYFLCVKAPAVPALQNVSLKIKRGEVLGLLGPNGSGKTTLQKIMCGLLIPNCGKVTVMGKEVSGVREGVGKEISYVFEGERTFYWRLTGRQNLDFFAALSGCCKTGLEQRISNLTRRLGLEEHLHKMFAAFSAGNRQKLSLVRALLTNPAVLVMDEPTRTLDPIVAQQLYGLVKELVRREGKAVIWATHNLAEAEAVCDRAVILGSGQVVAEAPAGSIRNTYFRLMYPEGRVV